MPVWALTLRVWLAAVPVEVTGDACPSREAIEAHLATLAPAPSSNRARVSRADTALQLELRDASGALLASRTLAVTGGCDALAEVAATVIAAWETDLQARPSALPPAPLPTTPLAWELGVGGFASYAERWTGGGLVDFALGQGRWSGVGSLSAVGAREVGLSTGAARWWWAAVALGVRLELWRGWARLDLQVLANAGWFNVEGRGFSQLAPPVQVVVPGATAGVRVSRSLGPLAFFFMVQGVGWFSAPVVRVGQVTAPDVTVQQRGLPGFELLLTLGATVGSR